MLIVKITHVSSVTTLKGNFEMIYFKSFIKHLISYDIQ